MSSEAETSLTISGAEVHSETLRDSSAGNGGHRPPLQNMIRHIYVHIPFCARICPYCAFYKELLDRSQTERFCEALLSELRQQALAAASPSGGGQDRPAFANGQSGSDLRRGKHLLPSTIYFGGGTPTA